jgi:hypothetical protein
MSDQERPELRALRDLVTLVGTLSEEMAAFRRRALVAESRVRELESAGSPGADDRDLRRRIADLERENGALAARLEAATTRTQAMLDRVHFLRQQAQEGER